VGAQGRDGHNSRAQIVQYSVHLIAHDVAAAVPVVLALGEYSHSLSCLQMVAHGADRRYVAAPFALRYRPVRAEKPSQNRAPKCFIGCDVVDHPVDEQRDGVWIASEILTDAKKALLSDEQRSEPEISSSNADSEKIISYLGMFGGLEEGIEVSSNPDNHNTYMVGAAGLRVTALSSDGKKIFDVIIGSGGPDFGSTYIRRADEEKVYLVRRPLLGIFSPRAQDWLAPESKEEDQIPLSDSNSPNR